MKKVARLRVQHEDSATSPTSGGGGAALANAEQAGVRTTGRIKKPKTVYDPSDNYLPRALQRLSSTYGGSPSVASPASTPPTSAATADSNERKREAASSTPEQLRSNKIRLSQSSIASNGASPGVASAVAASVVAANGATDAGEFCTVCMKREARRGCNAKNKLIACLECDRKVHKLCLKSDFEDIEMLRQYYKCDNCRMCERCVFAESADADKPDTPLVTCTRCIKSFHISCHSPLVPKSQQNQRKWKCHKCEPTLLVANGDALPPQAIRDIIGDIDAPQGLAKAVKDQDAPVNIAAAAAESKIAAAASAASIKRERRKTSSIATNGGAESETLEAGTEKRAKHHVSNGGHEPTEPPSNNNNNHTSNNNGGSIAHHFGPMERLDLHDVKYWSVEKVAEYIGTYFPAEAHVFREQEIDGMSLLLLKRSDVVKKLPIKLGPSLRLYSLILQIQTQENDPTLGWNCVM